MSISKSLRYAYYPTITELLRALLDREHRRLLTQQFEASESAETLEQLVRRITHADLSYIEERGPIIDRLEPEPSISDHSDPTAFSREAAVSYLTGMITDALGMDHSVADPMVDISFGLPAAAGHYLTRHDISRETLEDITVTMILGSMEAVHARYDTAFKPLRPTKPPASKSG